MSSENLVWSDIVSPTMTRDEYDEKFKTEAIIQENYTNYVPKPAVINEIENNLSKLNKPIKILAMGAAWCKDCKVQIPRLNKIYDTLESEKVDVKYLYGIKTNPYRKPGEIKWSTRHSPPEAINPKFAANKIPMIYFFDGSGSLLDLIEERPQKYATIEETLLAALKSK